MTDKLPPRDHTLPGNEQGLYQKYTVHRSDGKVDEPGTEYLVVKWDDPNAFGAILSYADSVQGQNPKLAADLRHKLGVTKQEKAYFSYGPDSGFELHDSAKEAQAAMQEDLQTYRGEADESNEWPDEVNQLCWGRLSERSVEVPITQDGVDYFDYQLQRI